ncbi:uncharacterized protein C3orf20-like isoform X1 [Nerophis lumbriciformis]|uniref:uncharacterized protein C3orf20-like isoform X1 n=1 Tax=Nerophis lumbriciformis TaxID=546530 RepID=UPI002ADFC1E4|nr:uncharacterized protein C3orf20-like isoform X1 [Nerophis lumbriciformis]XP_061780283.1 uncharacterized protein C3orf20-like isoform X1 [Nerophis lumbriciformis]
MAGFRTSFSVCLSSCSVTSPTSPTSPSASCDPAAAMSSHAATCMSQPAGPLRIRRLKVFLDANLEEQKDKRTENGKKGSKKSPNGDFPETQSREEESTEEGDDPSAADSQDPLSCLKRDAPELLKELGQSINKHKWTPAQLGDILNYTWAELRSAEPKNVQVAPKHKPKSSGRMKKLQKKEKRANEARASSNPNQARDSSSTQDPGEGCFVSPLTLGGESPSLDTCLWVVERLQATRSPQNPEAAEQDLNISPILRHYSDEAVEAEENKGATKPDAQPDANKGPGAPERTKRGPPRRKLHYRINDGTSFIYYPSGNMAVCHSHSGLTSGGFYSNVFTDNKAPIVLCSITMYGHGHVTHPVSSAITAVWDQLGGFICDRNGNMKQEWSWKLDEEVQEKIVVKVSKGISVQLHSSTSAVLCFKCDKQKVLLPITALPYLAKEPEAGLSLLDGEGMPGRWRKECLVLSELTKIHQKARDLQDAWLKFYQVATGIKRRKKKRKTSSKTKRKKRSSAAPAKKSAEKKKPAAPKAVVNAQPQVATTKQKPKQRLRPRNRESPSKNARAPVKHVREYKVTQIGALRIHGNIKRESVILPGVPDPRLAALPPCPAQSCLPSSVPLTVCPLLLRAALLRDPGEPKEQAPVRRCFCSPALMPVLTDAEYDAFIMGQPKHSQQILIVYVTLPVNWEEPGEKDAMARDAMQRLYRRSNVNRAMPCTQCQMDSFRLVRYEVSTGALGCPIDNILLQHRNNVAAGMILMYIRGTLMFLGYVSSGSSLSTVDLQKQILRTREDYRCGVSLPPDYKFSERPKVAAAPPDAKKADCPSPTGKNDVALTLSAEKECPPDTCVLKETS